MSYLKLTLYTDPKNPAVCPIEFTAGKAAHSWDVIIFDAVLKKLTLVLFTNCFLLIAYTQDQEIFKPDSIKKEIKAIAISGFLRVDGYLHEPEWSAASPSTRFIQIEPLQGEQPNFETTVKALYNRHYLYIGVFSKDSLGKNAIRATDFKRDFNFRQHDLITLAFDGFNDQRNAMSFATNAYGVQRDLLAFDDLYYDIDWDGVWRVRTQRTDSGWYAEMAIPWQTLRYPRSSDSLQKWGFNIYRNRRLSNELSAFSAFPRSFSVTRMAYAGLISNLKPPPPKPNIRIQPYVLSSYDQYKGFDASYPSSETNVKVGGDIKWAINPNAVLDLTANTDFAQADADRQVNNVTRFSVFFPERRQFFLENASLFGPGVAPADDQSGGTMRIQPFFSRRIGLDDAGNPIPIDAGGRFVYRSSKRNFGAIAMRQREQNGTPATNFFVGRYSENFGEQSRIGALVTVKNRPDSSNVVSAIDGFFRLGEAHSVNAMLMHSVSTHSGQQGYAGYAQYYYSTNQWKFWWTQSIVSKNFNPEMGFVSRNDVVGTTPGVFWLYRGSKLPFKKILRAFEPSLSLEFYHQASTGKLLERQIIANPIWLNFQNGGWFGYIVSSIHQQLIEDFEPLGVRIPVGKYDYLRHLFYVSTDQSKKINLMGTYEFGTYFNGHLSTADATLQIAPIPHISIATRFNRNYFKDVGVSGGKTTVDLYSIEGRFALNPRVQLIGFLQKNSENSSTNVNVRLSWEYQPLSFIYLVYNHRSFTGTLAQKQTEDHVIAKISYLRQL